LNQEAKEMTRERVAETGEGIQDQTTVEIYDELQRRLRDRGWIETKSIIRSGITTGHALEVGPGPGYLGLEWLKSTRDTQLTALEISPAMIELAARNAAEYGLVDRWRAVEGNALRMPFEDDQFDAVLTNGSLHEWEDPARVLEEIARVLRPGGRYFVSDLRRDMLSVFRWLLHLTTRPRAIRPGLSSSIDAAYTAAEIREVLERTPLHGARVSTNPIGLVIQGTR
jgi:ubiquinone/menaquinone biosynthesis C-methylase UbiE